MYRGVVMSKPLGGRRRNEKEIAVASSIAAYRPRKGKETQLFDAVTDHMEVLRAENLITNRPAHAMRAEDGTIVEVFEWKDR